MKRYLLLASVAGCLMNVGNAMAETTLYVSATANVERACTVEVTQNMDFGKVVLGNDYSGTTVLHMDEQGNITENGSVTGLVGFEDEGKPGVIHFNCSGMDITEKVTPTWGSSSSMTISSPAVTVINGSATGEGDLAISGDLYLASDASGVVNGTIDVKFDF